MASATVIIPTVAGARRLPRLLGSFAREPVTPQVIVVDNASTDGTRELLASDFPDVNVISLAHNEGFSRAVNLAAAQADGDAIVLVNDDCVCEPGFVSAITGALDPARGVVMAAGVLCDARQSEIIDTAGMELDRTLLVFDYLNGEPTSSLVEASDPIGPSGAAAAFDRQPFLDIGGFDERLFAYWEDVDLVLRLRVEGGRCRLAKEARGVHEHSATLRSGSRRKNYLTGFGRGYILRKWSVLSPRRIADVLARDAIICTGQAIVDRNVAGLCGRIDGFREAGAGPRFRYPDALPPAQRTATLFATLRRRAHRRLHLRRSHG